MAISEVDRNLINKAALFLKEQGYVMEFDENTIYYVKDDITLSIAYPPNSDTSSVDIRFNGVNRLFNIGWIALVRGGVKGYSEKLEDVKELLKYVRENYKEITNYQFCIDSDELIDEYCKKHEEEFQKKISDFLESNK